MLDTKLIEEAVKIIVDLWADEGIEQDPEPVRKNVIDWCNHTDINRPRLLAAAAICGKYEFGITKNELLERERFFFPETKEEGYI